MTESNPLNTSPAKLVRTHTPLPDTFLSHFTFREATLKGTTAANTRLNKDLSLSSPLCRDINSNSHNDDDDDDDESEYNSDCDDNGDDGDEGMKSQENNDDDDQEGRKRTSSVLDLDSMPGESPSFLSITRSGSPRALAMQADKKSKRVRVDPSTTIKKTVRFDESRNTKFTYTTENTGSSILARTITSASATRPVVSALIRRQSSTSTPPPFSFSPFTFNNSNTFNNSINNNINNNNNANNANHENSSSNQFSLSLENTSQDVMDFASSLSRLMGGSTESKSTFLSPPFSQASLANSANSPMRSISPVFQNSPPSPVRSSPMSTYSPPVSSSLSSFWSPSLGEDDEDELMESSQSSLSSRPISKPSGKFTPRRPRVSSPLRTQPTGPRPRFPSMLKREASNASFMDNYPASLTLDEPSTPEEPAELANQIPMMSNLQSGSPNHAAIAAAVLNMPSLTKSVSDVSITTSPKFDIAPQHRRSSSWDLGQTSTSSSNPTPNPPTFSPRFTFDAKKA
ncbi:hypothetical protein BGZ76_002878 [Entomortierella beljakovae]|nr:hypothetical protein BGZ76_002878 [Entomortierella beljakovae]